MQITLTHAENTNVENVVYFSIYVTYECLGCECVQFKLDNKIQKYSCLTDQNMRYSLPQKTLY